MQGVLYALVAAGLFGASTPLAKWLLGNGLNPWLLAGLLYGGAGIGLSVVYLLRGQLVTEARLQRRDLPWLALIVLFGGIAGPVLLMYGLANTSAASASLLLNLEGLATLLIAWLVLHEHVDRRLLLGALAILGGATLLSYHGADDFGIGTLAIAAACFCWGIDNNLTRKLSGSDPLQIAATKGIVAGCVNIALAMKQGAHWPGELPVVEAAVIGFFGYGISVMAFVLALRHLGTARTGAYFSTAPFIGAALSVLLLNDSISVPLLIAAALMGIGVYFHLTENHEHEHTHESLEHEHRHTHDAHHQRLHSPDDPPDEPHSHPHQHVTLIHRHRHYPDTHHRHDHQH